MKEQYDEMRMYLSDLEDFLSGVRNRVKELMELADAESLGLDYRAGSHIYVDRDYIAVKKRHRQALDYYGGFEYVDEEHVTVFGNYVFYNNEDERVWDCIEFFYKRKGE